MGAGAISFPVCRMPPTTYPVLCYDTARVPPGDEAERSLMPLAC